jgi:hypothetical protein
MPLQPGVTTAREPLSQAQIARFLGSRAQKVKVLHDEFVDAIPLDHVAITGAALWTYAEQVATLFAPLPTVQDPNGEDVEGAVSEDEYQRIKTVNRKKWEHYTKKLRKHIIEHRTVYNTLQEVGDRR